MDTISGNLSIVGPRPERPEIAALYEEAMPEFRLRLQAKAGLTGYAQVYGKYNTTPYDKLQMDLMYIAHPSILEDLRICLATVKILLLPESTEGVSVGQTTAMEREKRCKSTGKCRRSSSKIGLLAQKLTVFNAHDEMYNFSILRQEVHGIMQQTHSLAVCAFGGFRI